MTTNGITHISSTDVWDTQEVVVEWHIIDGVNLTFFTQTVQLNWQTPVALATPLARVTRAYNNNTVDFAGTIYIAENVSFTWWIPQTASAIHLMIPQGTNQSKKASTAISKDDFYVVSKLYLDVSEKQDARASAELQISNQWKVFRPVVEIAASSRSRAFFDFDPYIIIPPNTDIRIRAVANAVSTNVSWGFEWYLASINP